MTITRGIRALSQEYYRNFVEVPDTEENLSASVVLESDNGDCCSTLANLWPDSITLNASMNPIPIDSQAILERRKNQNFEGRISIYDGPKFDEQSMVKNSKMCCAKIIVRFENSGKFTLENKAQTFFGKDLGDYQLNFPDDYLWEKAFLFQQESILEITNEEGLLHHEDAGSVTFTRRKIYPYGGLFEYGMHPKQMESCIFYAVKDEKKSCGLRVFPLGALRNAGVDPTKNLGAESGYKFIGINNFSDSQKINLYDELKNGSCCLEVTNKNMDEKSNYKSCGVFHTPQTNLITINFMREE
jgi:hypothetical protein